MPLNTLLLVINTLFIKIFYRRAVHAVVQLVEALSCKPECRGFGSPWCQWNLTLT